MVRKYVTWNAKLLRIEGTKIHGDKILYHLLKEGDIKSGDIFNLQCKICLFIWLTKRHSFIDKKKGCPWCENKCKGLQYYTLDMVIFVGEKLHDDKYDYSNNIPEDIKTRDDIINIWCKIEKHECFRDRIGDHLSLAKRAKHIGCLKCKEEDSNIVISVERNPAKSGNIILSCLKARGLEFMGIIISTITSILYLLKRVSHMLIFYATERTRMAKFAGIFFLKLFIIT